MLFLLGRIISFPRSFLQTFLESRLFLWFLLVFLKLLVDLIFIDGPSDDKHLARRETMKLILSLVRYKGRNRKLDFTLAPDIVIPGDREFKIMKKQLKKYGKSLV